MNEFDAVQNNALGASALYHFCNSYYKAKDKSDGILLPLTLPVLPLVFNEYCLSAITTVKRMTKGSFLNVVANNRSIPVGLQARMISMQPQTFKSLHIAFNTGLLEVDATSSQLIPKKLRGKNALPPYQFADNIRIILAANILGRWFAQHTVEEICIPLNITF